MMASSKKKNLLTEKITNKFKSILFSTQGFPLFLMFTFLAVMFVLFRMKNVEMDYKIAKMNKEIERVLLDNKDLKAKKARLLSTERLRRIASDNGLNQPTQEQIIVVP